MVAAESIDWRIRNMSIIAALMVVALHTGYSDRLIAGTPGCWLYRILCDNLFQMAVPYFFVVSGFFLARRLDGIESWKGELVKRCRTLLIPYFSWTFLYSVIVVAFSLIADMKAGRVLGGNLNMGGLGWLKYLGLHPFYAPTFGVSWFLLSLFVMSVLSILIVRIVLGRLGFVVLAALFGMMLAIRYFNNDSSSVWYHFFRYRFSVQGLFYFSLGIFLRFNCGRIQYDKKVATFLVIPFCLVLTLLMIKMDYPLLLGDMSIIFYLWGFYLLTPRMEMQLSSGVQFCGGGMLIYLVHFIFVYIIRLPLDLNRIDHQVVRYLTVLSASLFIGAIGRKLFPRTMAFLLGGR